MNQRFQREEIKRVHEKYASNKLYTAIRSIGADLEAEQPGFGMCTEECFVEVMEVLSFIAGKEDSIASTDIEGLWKDKYNEYRRFDRQVGNDEIRKVIGIVFGYTALALSSSESRFYRFTVCRMVQENIIDNEPEDFDSTIDRIFDVQLEDGWFDNFMEGNNMETYENIIFKDNVDVSKVMKQLAVFVESNVLESQKHWFIVYKVFRGKDWLKRTTHTDFRNQMNAAFQKRLKCTKEDFGKVDKYFKDNDYADWTLDDPRAPSCCEEYKKIADALDHEFADKMYAKPGTLINTRKIEKLR